MTPNTKRLLVGLVGAAVAGAAAYTAPVWNWHMFAAAVGLAVVAWVKKQPWDTLIAEALVEDEEPKDG